MPRRFSRDASECRRVALSARPGTLQIWDVRTGGIFETLKYDHAVTALQFDTRKVVAATGENGIKVGRLPTESSTKNEMH